MSKRLHLHADRAANEVSVELPRGAAGVAAEAVGEGLQ